MKNVAVFAILRDRPHAESGVRALVDSGFRESDISILSAENTGNKDLAHEKHSKAPEGATLGAVIGLIVVGVFAALVGLGDIVIPALAPYAANGPVMCALAGVGAGGVIGGILGFLIGAGIPEFEAKRYAGLIKEGRSLLSVHCEEPDSVKRARQVLKSVGGHHVVPVDESGAGFTTRRETYLGVRHPHGSLR